MNREFQQEQPERPLKPLKARRLRHLVSSIFLGVGLIMTTPTPTHAHDTTPAIGVTETQGTKPVLRETKVEVEDDLEVDYDLSSYRLPFDNLYMITQGPSNFTIDGRVCDRNEHSTHQNLASQSIDFLMPEGVPILASQAGEVIFAGWKPSYGQVALVRHADGLVSWYAHLSEFGVKVGDTVKIGGFLGKSGKTGTSAAHLHFEIRDGIQSISLLNLPGIELYGGWYASCIKNQRFEGHGKPHLSLPYPVVDQMEAITEQIATEWTKVDKARISQKSFDDLFKNWRK